MKFLIEKKTRRRILVPPGKILGWLAFYTWVAQKCNKKSSFPLFRGSRGQIKFLIEKKHVGKNIRSTCLLYMGAGGTRSPPATPHRL